MNTKRYCSAFMMAALALIHFPAENGAHAQGENRHSPQIAMVVNAGTSEERQQVSHHGLLEPVGLRPSEQIAVTLNVPTSWVNFPVGIALLDGGDIASENPPQVKNGGTVDFMFQGGGASGFYRVLVTIGGEQYELEFYVMKPSQPDGLCP